MTNDVLEWNDVNISTKFDKRMLMDKDDKHNESFISHTLLRNILSWTDE